MRIAERSRIMQKSWMLCSRQLNRRVAIMQRKCNRFGGNQPSIQTEGKSRGLASTAAGVGLGMSASRQSFTQRNRGRDGGRIGSGICRVYDPAGWYSMRCGMVLIHRWEFVCLSVRVCCSTGYMYVLIRRRWDGMSGMSVRGYVSK
jgi:hypothetical protein